MGEKKKDKIKKEPKRKPKYGMLFCVAYIYRLLWQTERSLAFVGIFTVPVSLALSALNLYTPPVILSVLEDSGRFSYIALVIVGLLLVKKLFELMQSNLSMKIGGSELYMLSRMVYMRAVKVCDRDWYLQYDPVVLKLDERARNATQNNHVAGVHFPMDFSHMVSQILNFFLFGSVISLLHPMVIVLLAVGCMLNYGLEKRRQNTNWKEQDERNDLGKKLFYSTVTLSRSAEYAKDIRLYSMNGALKDRIQHLLKLDGNVQKKLEARSIFTAIGNFFFILVRDGAAYAFLIMKAVQGEVDASSFVLYFSAITSMSGLMSGIMGVIARVSEGAMQVSDFRENIELKDNLNRGEGIPVPKGPFSIEFRHVSYQYPEGEKKVLDDVTFTIRAGEKIALVGLNGAGKTTLTMLMCGLLLPTEGEILLDGHTLYEYNRDELYRLFGMVPQDYHLLPLSIARNIAATMTEEEIDGERLNQCIEMAGLTEKIASLPKGVKTPLDREIYAEGIDLSGGEKQKVLMARLLYRDPPCMILDEPTAALDPIAEDNLYRKYNACAAHATSVFISHRLASTRFCDRIFLLDGAKIAETGTHDELMAAGGKYRELFDVQSKYYREEAKQNEA